MAEYAHGSKTGDDLASNALIQERLNAKRKQKVYVGDVTCPNCGIVRRLETTAEDKLINPPLCFRCFMNNEAITNVELRKRIKEVYGTPSEE